MADVEEDSRATRERFFTKNSLDKIDETRLASLPPPADEPQMELNSIDLTGIIPADITPKLQETQKCLSSTYSWETTEEDRDLKKWCFVYKNKSSFDMTVKMDFTDSSHLEYNTDHRQEGDQVWAEVPPFQETIVLIITADNRQGWSLTSSVNMKFSTAKNGASNDYLEQEILERCNQFKDLGMPRGSSIVHWLHEVGSYFIDLDFSPLNNSIYDHSGKNPPPSSLTSAVWRRVRDFVEKEPIIVNTIHPNDVQQGQLGDCWILSSITALAEHPELVEKLLVTQRVNQVGLFQVQLCVRGLWQTITLDEYLPCTPQGSPKFTKAQQNELWVSLLEKGFAKTYGSYQRIIEGDASHGMTMLTGNPVRTMRFKDQTEEILWTQMLNSAGAEEDLLTVSTSLGKSKLVETGLQTKHSYTVLDAKEGGGVRLLQIRNPWGHGEWRGAWSDTSELWTDEMRQIFNPTSDSDDGTFWMAFEDVLKYFSRMTICYCNLGVSATRLPVSIGISESDNMFKFVQVKVQVPSSGKISWIGLHQWDARIRDAPSYADITCLIFKKEGDAYIPHSAFINYKNFSFEEVNLTAGSYEFTVFTSGRDLGMEIMRDVTITLHKDCECMVECFSVDNMEVLRHRLIDYSKTGDSMEYLEGRLKMFYIHKSIHVWSVQNVCEDYEIEITAKLGLNNMHTCVFLDEGVEPISISVGIQSEKLVTAAVIKDYKKNSGLTRNMDMTGRPVS